MAEEKQCKDKKCPIHGNVKPRGKIFIGRVKSAKMQNTVIVEWERKFYLKKYERYALEYPQQGAILFSNLIYYGVNIDELFAIVSYPKQISQLQSELSTAQGKISELEGQVASLQSSMPMYAVGGIIAGLVVGFAIAYFMKKK